MMPNDDTPAQARWRALLGGTALALSFLSRLPAGCRDVAAGTLATAVAAFPIAGMLLGAAAGLVYLAAWKLGLYPLIAATVTIAFLVWLTRGLHEDGLADFADGMAGATPEQRLAIMRDSRIGSYGVLALILVLAARGGSLLAIADSPAGSCAAAAALVAAHTLSRAGLAPIMWALPHARSDGLAAATGRPGGADALAAAVIGVVAAVLLLDLAAALVAVLAVAVVQGGLALQARRQIGGVTGDVLGAAQQLGEAAVLLVACANLSGGS